jgi:hypothetical protein
MVKLLDGPAAGRCRECGCTDERTCPGGCAWVDASHTLCSRCCNELCGFDDEYPQAVRESHHSNDVSVNDAFRDGRGPDEIMIVDCPRCGWQTYYNEGSHWTCRNPQCNCAMDGDQAVEECRSIDDCITEEIEREDLP